MKTDAKKLQLSFSGQAPAAIHEMADATLAAGGFDRAIAEPKPLEIGDKMPDGIIYAGTSPDAGKPMYVMPADASLTMKWKEAMNYAAKLDAHGHQDWRLPTKGELKALFNNRAAIGGFNLTGLLPEGWYWSASKNHLWLAWCLCQSFSDGRQFNDYKFNRSSVRCVLS